jgi:NitT/TauT family transport system substrate-binding protein
MRLKLMGAALAVALGVVTQAGAAGTAWRHGMLEAKSDSGIYFMITKGFAEKQGLKLEISQFKSDAVGLKAFLAGDLDSYESALNATIVAASRGVDVKLIGCHWQGQPLAVFVRPTIQSPQDLKGRTMAISTPFSNPDVLARLYLQSQKIPEDAVTFANMGSDTDRFKALISGVADATVVSIEYTPIAEKQGVRILAKASDFAPDYVRQCQFITGKTLATRRNDVIHFAAAEMAALRFAMSHRAEVIALTHELTQQKPDDPRAGYIYDDAVATKAVDPTLSIPMAKLQWMEQLLLKGGHLSAPYDLTKMIDADVRVKALALLAPSQ